MGREETKNRKKAAQGRGKRGKRRRKRGKRGAADAVHVLVVFAEADKALIGVREDDMPLCVGRRDCMQ